MATDKEELENLMAISEQAREAQKRYFNTRSKDALRDAKIKEDALDNLLKYLRFSGYTSKKTISKEPEQKDLF